MSTSKDETLTVGQLIEKLQQFDARLPVFTEGCDCSGNAADVIFCRANDDPYGPDDHDYVYIVRWGGE